ncbi:MAG: hypothetical protein LBJ82_05710 [Deltaproteobacteria bacterium]|jgi:hypothetical protein|nr:hypothetical protein [Deltaproteobacteria bacterium]
MQRVLEKMAKELNAYDEASLMQLWQQYALRVNNFEPTRRWEEAAIALCLIQAVHWKNHLFNYHLAATATPDAPEELPLLRDFFPQNKAEAEESGPRQGKATVLRFPLREPK